MNCDKWVRKISLMLDGSLGDGETARLREHLDTCPACRAELALQTEIERALGVEAHSGLPADFTERVGEKALQLAGKRRNPLPWPVMVPPLATAAAAAALFFLGTELAGQNPAAFEGLVGALIKPLASLSGVVGGLLEGAADLVPSLDQAATRTAGMVAALLSGAVPVYWGLRRFFVYLS